MFKHLDVCTHIDFNFDHDILKRRLFDVNMRLFQSSPDYKSIVLCCAEYIRELARTTREGYKTPHGFSGANAGIPFNIIADQERVYLNPVITYRQGVRRSTSNCGSLTLKEPIEIWRYEEISVDYFDLEGAPHTIEGYLPTLQHEIDHNNGILITDRQVKP